MAENLLVTKLYIPSPTLNHVPRPRLFQLLDEGLRMGRSLTLISAPAGYGKTTLISEWLHYRQLHAAWLSIDEGDNDPTRFLSYLVAAIRAVKPEVEDYSPFQSSPGAPFEPALVSLVNKLAILPGTFLIVLDDYHAIHAQSIHDSLSFLIENLPAHVHIIIATRADPALPVARLRARGKLNELRMSDLRFTSEETATLLNQIMGLSLSSEDIAGLDNRTEGWAAGLQMVALALYTQASIQESKNLSGFIRSFTGSNRYILDYFVEEVLHRQPEAIITFLRQTSILERLCGSLCDAVTEIKDWHIESNEPFSYLQSPISGGKILQYLDHANLFIVPLDDRREWYRYHRLFSDLLYQRLLLLQPEIVPVLHQRASTWYEQHQLSDEAIRHAFAAGDTRHAAELIEAVAEATLMRSEIATFIGWIEQLPEMEIINRPDLIVYHSLTLLWMGAPLEVIEAKLALIEQSKNLLGKEASLRAFIALNKGQISLAREYCRQGLELIPDSDLLLHGLAELMQAICYTIDGDVQRGTHLLENAVITNQKTGNQMVAVLVLYQLAELRQKEGRLHQAEALYRQVLELASDTEGRHLPIAGRALVGLGEIAWARNDLEVAQRYVLEGNELTEKWSHVSTFDGFLALVAIRQSQGDFEGAGQALKILRNIAQRFDVTEADDLVVDLVEARLRFAQGDLDAVHKWVEQRGLEGIPTLKTDRLVDDIISQRLYKYEILVLARLCLAEGRYDEVLEILNQQLARLDQIDRPVLVIETELLRALAFQERKETENAVLALEHALSLTEPEGFVRIYVDGGERMKTLLRSTRSRLKGTPFLAFVDKLLPAFASETEAALPIRLPQPTMLIEPLSEREIEVLRLLSSSLSIREMSDELYISIHTMRSHLKSIYGKMGVHSRYEAISRAQELDLL